MTLPNYNMRVVKTKHMKKKDYLSEKTNRRQPERIELWLLAVPARSAYDRLWPSRTRNRFRPIRASAGQQAGRQAFLGTTYESAVTALGPVGPGTAPISWNRP